MIVRFSWRSGFWASLVFLASFAAQAAPKQSVEPDGAYSAHDVFGQLDGAAWVRYGTRDFVASTHRIAETFENESGAAVFGSHDFSVASGLRFNIDGGAFNGSYLSDGSVAVHVDRVAVDVETGRLKTGYAGMRVSARRGSGLKNSLFKGSYSYHALIGQDTKTWDSVLGAADSVGTGTFALMIPGVLARAHTYAVGSDGRMSMDGRGANRATIHSSGGLIFESYNVSAGENPVIPELVDGFKGLAVYVRRGTDLSASNFSGTYRVHEIRVTATHAQSIAVGTIAADGTGVYAGTLDRAGAKAAFNGRIIVNPSGTFRFSGSAEEEGTLGLDGAIAVVTKFDGKVTDGVSGEAWLQIWLRTAGGGPTNIDSDGDGLLDSVEDANGNGRVDVGETDPNNADTDGDGLEDGVDPAPLVRNDTYSVTPTALTFAMTEGGTPPVAKVLTIDGNVNPFFRWTVTGTTSWLSATPLTGQDDGTVSVSVDATGLDYEDSPFAATLRIAAENMANGPIDVPVTFTISPPPPELSLSETSLVFQSVEGVSGALLQNVELRNLTEAPFTWTVQSSATWLDTVPASGDSDTTVAVIVDPQGLSAQGSPFTGTLRFTATNGINNPQVLTVRLELADPRGVDEAFRVSPGSNSQTEPAVAFDASLGAYAMAWEENNSVYAARVDAGGMPLGSASKLSLATGAAATRPTVVAVPSEGVFWVLWSQAISVAQSPDIFAHVLPSGEQDLSFGAVTLSGAQVAPRAVYDATREEVLVVCEGNQSGSIDVYFNAIGAATRVSRVSTSITALTGDQVTPDLAVDSQRGEVLVVWTDEAHDPEDASQSRIMAQRISAATGGPLGLAFPLYDVPGQQTNPRIVVNLDTDEAAIVWEFEGDAGSEGIAMARFALGSDGDDLIVDHVSTSLSTNALPAVAYAPDGEQYRVLWSNLVGLSRDVLGLRVAENGYPFGPVTAIDEQGTSQQMPQITANPVANEFLAVWSASISGTRLLYAKRFSGGVPDEDNDGLPNAWEAQYGLDAFDASGDNGANGDPDGDGIVNGAERIMGTSPLHEDTDGDGLWDGQEDRDADGVVDGTETSATMADTDGDGANDGTEHFLGSDARNAAAMPDAGVVRVEYDASFPGIAQELTVHLYIAAAGVYALGLNSTPGSAWSPPEGWSAVQPVLPETGLLPGEHALAVTVTPPASPTGDTALGDFRFSLLEDEAVLDSMTVALVCDIRTTWQESPGKTEAAEIARKYAPILRNHRDAHYLPADINAIRESGTLFGRLAVELTSAPQALDLQQSPQRESNLDLQGDSLADLRSTASVAMNSRNPTVYFTVVELGSSSVAAGGVSTDIVIQYFIPYFADEWGIYTNGGYRHETDWAVVQVMLDAQLRPHTLTVTQHLERAEAASRSGSVSAAWTEIEVVEGHPVLFPGAGSHALYLRAGAHRVDSAVDVHDGYGMWVVPPDDSLDVLPLDTAHYALTALSRLGEDDAPSWLRYAGRWGDIDFPAGTSDESLDAERSGPRGPVFLGNRSVAAETGVRSLWLDPFAWQQRADAFAETMTTVQGQLPEVFYGATVALLAGDGRIYFAPSDPEDGAFQLSVSWTSYTLSLIGSDDGAHIVTARFPLDGVDGMLLPTVAGGIQDLGLMAYDGTVLTASGAYAASDTDGDGVKDDTDPDIDNDGIANPGDDDALGDGFHDTVQIHDLDNDGIPDYFDDDDDGDGIPDAEDEDRNGNDIPDAEEPSDTDGDGVVDALDFDRDNDMYDNVVEAVNVTSSLRADDTPDNRLGDLNGSGAVDSADYQALIDMRLGRIPEDLRGDFNNDGRINIIDIRSAVNRILGRVSY